MALIDRNPLPSEPTKPVQATVIYDGTCNLCVNWVRLLVQIDPARQFAYLPMQDPKLAQLGISPEDCQQGMILLGSDQQRWQGSQAAEEIARRLPGGEMLVAAYRALPGLKGLGDRAYLQIRDNRYDWFGQRPTYWVTPTDHSIANPGANPGPKPEPNSDPESNPIDPTLTLPLDPGPVECNTESCCL